MLGDHAARSLARLRAEIVSRLVHVPSRQLERTGSARILSALFGSQWRDLIAFVVLIVLLMFRPTGLLGESLGRARA